MFRIGEFARLGQMSVKALRHYDEIGLLRPSQVDAATSYRYYAPAQLRDLARILTLKDLGFSLAQIGPLLQSGLPAGQIEALLRLKQAELAERVRIEQARLDLVTRRLQHMEQGGSPVRHEIQIKAVPEQTVLALRQVLESDTDPRATGDTIGIGFRRLYETLAARRTRPSGPSIVCWNERQKGEETGGVLLAVPVADIPENVSAAEEVFIHSLPAVPQMACVTYHGPLMEMEQAYLALIAWIEENDYRICGPHRDVVLHYAGDPESDSVNEAQFPVTRVCKEELR